MKIDSPQILNPTVTGSLFLSGSLNVLLGVTSSRVKLTSIPTVSSNTQFLTLDGNNNVGKRTIGGTLYTGSTYPITASWAVNAINGGTKLNTGSSYPITSSWAITASYALNAGASGTTLNTGSTYPITSSCSFTNIIITIQC